MALLSLADLVRVAIATTGTGTVTLGAAVAGFLTFAGGGIANGATVPYAIVDANGNREVGVGVYNSATPSLTRVLGSSSTGALLNLSGNAQLVITPTKASLAIKDSTGVIQVDAGLKFPASVALQADANTLDDYEEGTFTPTLTFGGASVGVAYNATNRWGEYLKIGNHVFYRYRCAITSKGSSTGAALISGLPFSCVSTAGYGAMSYMANFASLSGFITGYPIENTTTFNLETFFSGATAQLNNSNFSGTEDFVMGGHYRTAA